MGRLQEKTRQWEELDRETEDLAELAALAQDENDPGLNESLILEARRLEERLELLERLENPENPETGPADDHVDDHADGRQALVVIRAGAGGQEAQDWARMLAAMYTAWAEREQRPVERVDTAHGEGDGIRSSTIIIGGESAYATMRGEHGVHRLVRISPFGHAGRRQTSMASVEVLPVSGPRAGTVLNRSDIAIDTFRASGPGGQNVNKLATAVRLTHLPSGVTAVCRTERSQLQNRNNAMRLLAVRIEEKERRETLEKQVLGQDERPIPEWGHRVRSYFLHPRQQVIDHRTGVETGRALQVLQGWLDPFLTGGDGRRNRSTEKRE